MGQGLGAGRSLAQLRRRGPSSSARLRAAAEALAGDDDLRDVLPPRARSLLSMLAADRGGSMARGRPLVGGGATRSLFGSPSGGNAPSLPSQRPRGREPHRGGTVTSSAAPSKVVPARPDATTSSPMAGGFIAPSLVHSATESISDLSEPATKRPSPPDSGLSPSRESIASRSGTVTPARSELEAFDSSVARSRRAHAE